MTARSAVGPWFWALDASVGGSPRRAQTEKPTRPTFCGGRSGLRTTRGVSRRCHIFLPHFPWVGVSKLEQYSGDLMYGTRPQRARWVSRLEVRYVQYRRRWFFFFFLSAGKKTPGHPSRCCSWISRCLILSPDNNLALPRPRPPSPLIPTAAKAIIMTMIFNCNFTIGPCIEALWLDGAARPALCRWDVSFRRWPTFTQSPQHRTSLQRNITNTQPRPASTLQHHPLLTGFGLTN